MTGNSLHRALVFGLAAISIALVGACSPSTISESKAVETPVNIHPVSGLKVIDLTVTSGKKHHKFRVEVAQSPAEQGRGLMFRAELGPNEGMIFPRSTPGYASFWMKNTPLPLDIIFVAPDGKIINIAANTVPYSLESVKSEGVTGVVLEIPGGRAAELGLKQGDSVKY